MGENPNKPQGFSFPKQSYGHKKVTNRAFQQKWWRWLYYDSGGDRVFCYMCVKALKTGKIMTEVSMKLLCCMNIAIGKSHLEIRKDWLLMNQAQCIKGLLS